MSDSHAPQGDDEYSATVLGSHWFSGPPAAAEPVAPDRVEGSVLRFGPGVTAAMPAPFPVSAALAAPPRRRRGAGLRRYALAAVVLAAVLAYLGWQPMSWRSWRPTGVPGP